MKKQHERDFKGIWIPKEIWLSKNLTIQEKVFLVEIDSLDRDEKGCYAGNKYFSEFFGLSEDRCSNIISSLKKKIMIDVKVDKSSGKSLRRILSLANLPTRQKRQVGVGENAEWPLGENAEWPLGENAIPNNTEENNTVNKEATLRVATNELIVLFKDFNPSYERIFKNRTERAALQRLLDKMGREKLEATIKFAAKANGMAYAPTITTPYELEKKLGSLIAFYNKENSKGQKNAVVIAI
jgi:hypothetical protein